MSVKSKKKKLLPERSPSPSGEASPTRVAKHAEDPQLEGQWDLSPSSSICSL